MATQLVVYPWIDRFELRNVFHELYSDDMKCQEHAMGRISAWQARARSKMPVAVDCTLDIVRANVAYQRQYETCENDTCLRELYSLAIIRFVNLVCERSQQSMFSLPIHVLGKSLGIPNWIVDLRHEATHGALPSLPELRAASQFCLRWLRRKFWEVQCAGTLHDLENLKQIELEDLIVNYMQFRYQEIKKKARMPKTLLHDLEYSVKVIGIDVCRVLMEDGYMLATEEQVESLGLSKDAIIKSADKSVPDEIFLFWRPVCSLLVKTGAMPALLQHITSIVDNVTPYSFRNILLCKWLYTFIFYSQVQEGYGGDDFGGYDIPREILLKQCLQIGGVLKGCIILLKKMLALSSKQKGLLKQLQSLGNDVDQFSGTFDAKNDMVFSVDDISKADKKGESCWQISTDNTIWSLHAFGILPDQTLGYTSLEIGSNHTGFVPDITEEENSGDKMEHEHSDGYVEYSNSIQKQDCMFSSTKFYWEDKAFDTIVNNIIVF